jgi:hypothetical protein
VFILKLNPELVPLAQVVTQELYRLENKINDMAIKLFGEANHEKMILKYLIFVESDTENDEGKKIYSSEYLCTHSKLNCAIAAYLLGQAKGSAVYATSMMSIEHFFNAMGFITDSFLFIGAATEHQEGLIEKSRMASKNGGMAHIENRAMKVQAIQYYKDNYKSYTSKDNAAFAIAGKVLPVSFATVRGWLKGVNPE